VIRMSEMAPLQLASDNVSVAWWFYGWWFYGCFP
jgi:hypothetical protein